MRIGLIVCLTIPFLVAGCGSEQKSTGPSDSDTTAPQAVADLAAASPTPTSLTLTWTAPGDDGTVGRAAGYDLRYSTVAETPWDVMFKVEDLPRPRNAGGSESLVVSGLLPQTQYCFRLKTSDEVPNWSTASNPACCSTGTPAILDTIPPNTVTDLKTRYPSTTSITLYWTAPGDDDVQGVASEYDIRYSTTPITTETWAAAQRVLHPPSPRAAGMQEVFEIVGLPDDGSRYTFALKARDEVPDQWSAMSSVAAGTLLYQVTKYSSGGSGVQDFQCSADGARVAFSLVDLWVMSSSGDSSIRLAELGLHPDWSPDGATIAFDAGDSVYVVSADGGNARAVGAGLLPTWSPDGERLAYLGWDLPERNVWMVSRSGGEASRVTQGLWVFSPPRWSHDGDRLAFVAMQEQGDVAIWVAPVSGGEAVRVARFTGHVFFDGPQWSPDGSVIVFGSALDGPSAIWKVSSAGGDPSRIADGYEPRWSLDGSRIIFGAHSPIYSHIWVVDATGGEPIQLTDGACNDLQPAWCGAASRIAFLADRGGNGVFNIYLLSSE